jgi:hypothetical protein
MGTGDLAPGVRRPRIVADHQPPLAPRLRMGRTYTSNFPLCLHRHIIGWPKRVRTSKQDTTSGIRELLIYYMSVCTLPTLSAAWNELFMWKWINSQQVAAERHQVNDMSLSIMPHSRNLAEACQGCTIWPKFVSRHKYQNIWEKLPPTWYKCDVCCRTECSSNFTARNW